MAISIDTFFLDPDSQGTLQAQIQQMIAQGILAGRYAKGEKLPSSRKLATHLGISRITVTLAYTELLANDYLTSRGRSGYFVSDNAPEPPKFAPQEKKTETVDWSRAIGQKFTGGSAPTKPVDWQKYKYPFIYGQVDKALFDHANWRLCALQALGARDFSALTADYYDQDDPQLIEFILRHTLPRRGIVARPEEVLITVGAQNALWLTAQILLTQRRTAAIEDPCYHALRDVLTQSRCHLSPIPVDRDGIQPELIEDGTDVIFTTPSHQCPTSATMPHARRKELLERARDLEAIIVEDDYEFEVSFLGAPMPALKSLDEDGRVIYVGSFSKSIFPGLRLGYLVGSEEFIREARALRASVLRHPPGHIQRTTAYFLSLGHYDALVRKISKVYQKRREVMETSLKQHNLEIAGRGVYGGSSFWMRAPENVATFDLKHALLERNVLIETGHPYFAAGAGIKNFYRLAYSSISEDLIPEGVSRIAEGVEQLSRQ